MYTRVERALRTLRALGPSGLSPGPSPGPWAFPWALWGLCGDRALPWALRRPCGDRALHIIVCKETFSTSAIIEYLKSRWGFRAQGDGANHLSV